MAKSKRANDSSDRGKWNKIFNSMVHLVKKQQIQLQSFAKERKLLQDRIILQHERWVFDVNLYQDQISQMEKQSEIQELERSVLCAKANLITGLKNREAFVYKQKFENTDDELADFREWILSLPDPPESGEKNRCITHQNDSIGQTSGHVVSSLDHKAEIASLLAEKNFVWNQYKEMESNLNKQLQERRAEVESANEKIQALVSSLEKLQTSSSHKDKAIEKLENEVAKLRSEVTKKDEETSGLGKELEALRKSLNNTVAPALGSRPSRSATNRSKSKNDGANNTVTPVLRQCSSRSATSRSSSKNERAMILKKDLDSLTGSEKGSRSSKRKTGNADRACDTPRLFTSSFKVPKLKSPSPQVH